MIDLYGFKFLRGKQELKWFEKPITNPCGEIPLSNDSFKCPR